MRQACPVPLIKTKARMTRSLSTSASTQALASRCVSMLNWLVLSQSLNWYRIKLLRLQVDPDATDMNNILRDNQDGWLITLWSPNPEAVTAGEIEVVFQASKEQNCYIDTLSLRLPADRFDAAITSQLP